MFFSIGRDTKDNFSFHYQLGPFAVSTDAGWVQHCDANYTAVYKGYADSDRLINVLDQIAQQTEPVLLEPPPTKVLSPDAKLPAPPTKTER
jgi:hypothetical protein